MTKPIIDQARQAEQVRDTLIMQKVNQAHREAFKTRFPAQIEHIMRLTAERLHHLLLKKPDDLGNPETWACLPSDIRELTQALHMLADLHQNNPVE